MMMMSGLLTMAVLVLVPFMLASVRHVLVRVGRPKWLCRLLRARTPSSGVGVGATATDELHAFLNANKRVQLERRQEQLALRDDTLDGAPPQMGIDLDAGTAVVRKRH